MGVARHQRGAHKLEGETWQRARGRRERGREREAGSEVASRGVRASSSITRLQCHTHAAPLLPPEQSLASLPPLPTPPRPPANELATPAQQMGIPLSAAQPVVITAQNLAASAVRNMN